MSQSKKFCRSNRSLAKYLFRFSSFSCVCLLFAGIACAQSQPPAPSYSNWQPPLTKTTTALASHEEPVADSPNAFPRLSASPQSNPLPPATERPPADFQSQTNMVNLQPPRDIFTQQTPPRAAPFSARPLSDSFPRTASNPKLDLQNAMPDVFGSRVAQTNLDSTTHKPSTDLSAFTDATTDKIGEVKDWMQTQTSNFLDAKNMPAGGWLEKLSSLLGGADVKKIGGSLAIVIGGYLGLVWLLRMINPRGQQGIPSEVLEVVGNAPLDSRQNLQLVRLGSKLLLMLQSPEGTQPVGEVTDPAEVEHLVALCNGKTRSASSAMTHAVNRHQGTQSASSSHGSSSLDSSSLNLSANQQSSLTQLLSAFNTANRGGNTRSYEA